jgi:hypothetical protein
MISAMKLPRCQEQIGAANLGIGVYWYVEDVGVPFLPPWGKKGMSSFY